MSWRDYKRDRGALSWMLDAREAGAWQICYGIFKWLNASLTP